MCDAERAGVRWRTVLIKCKFLSFYLSITYGLARLLHYDIVKCDGGKKMKKMKKSILVRWNERKTRYGGTR